MSQWSSLLLAGVVAACVSTAEAEEKKVPAALNFKVKSITGKDVAAAGYGFGLDRIVLREAAA